MYVEKKHRKILKWLRKRCPECDSILLEVIYSEENNGIVFEEKIIECSDEDKCGCKYVERKQNKHRDKEEFDE
jgi:hypothetical protein